MMLKGRYLPIATCEQVCQRQHFARATDTISHSVRTTSVKSALAARDSVGMCKSERDVCVALLFVVCYYHRIRSLPRAQSGRADHTLQSMQAPSVAFTMGVEGGSATLTSMKQHSHRLVKKLTSSACRATRYGQRLRTVLSGSPRCTRASMPR